MNQTAQRLEFVALDGTVLDYLVISPERNKTVVTGGNLMNHGIYLMKELAVREMAENKLRQTYRKMFKTRLLEYKK